MIPTLVESIFLNLSDVIYRYLPQKIPEQAALKKVKLISHRGQHDNQTCYENTLEAFTAAHNSGAYGIELDIRWTKDCVPVVIHDATTKRVFGKDYRVAELTAAELCDLVPQIPRLEEVIVKFGKTMHLMIELKDEAYTDAKQKNATLKNLLQTLTPGQDYHIISLAPYLFELIDFAPAKAYVPIVLTRTKPLFCLVEKNHYAGLAGHFVLLRSKTVKQLQAQNHLTGTGQIASPNCLWREINRGVEWIFTNDIVLLHTELVKQIGKTEK